MTSVLLSQGRGAMRGVIREGADQGLAPPTRGGSQRSRVEEVMGTDRHLCDRPGETDKVTDSAFMTTQAGITVAFFLIVQMKKL